MLRSQKQSTPPNKLKSLKVAQVKDEMNGDEDDGCDGVCDDSVWFCVMMLCVILCGDVVCDGVWDVVWDGVSGGECCGKLKWMILSCNWQTDRQTN